MALDRAMRIVVIGASVRAAAGSLLRAGCRPVAFDLYADVDLAAGAEAFLLDPATYPGGAWDAVRDLGPVPWMFTGALENHPDLVGRIATRLPLAGTGPTSLRAVRDPIRLAGAVRRAGLPVPTITLDPAGIPTDGSYLAKPVRSGGGEGIRPWLGQADTALGDLIYQERMTGRSCSAIFLQGPADIEFLGATRQFHGRPENPYAYRGTLGPWRFSSAVEAAVVALGRTIGAAFGLVGLFGVDLMVAGGRVWPIEVNPRYTASVEVLEQALGRSIVADHLRACGIIPPDPPPPRQTSRFVAKEILFARSPGRLDRAVEPRSGLDSFPEVADLPGAGTQFERGQPILTVFGRGDTPAACRRDLARRLRRWEDRLRRCWA